MIAATDEGPLVTLCPALERLGVGLRMTTSARRPIQIRCDRRQGVQLRLHPLVFAIDEVEPLLLDLLARDPPRPDPALARLVKAVTATCLGMDHPPARWFLPVLGSAGRERLVILDDLLARRGIRLQLTDHRQTLVNLRHDSEGGLCYAIHFQLLECDEAFDDLRRYALRFGRGRYQALDRALHRIARSVRRRWGAGYPTGAACSRPIVALDPIGSAIDLPALADEVHQRWFADLPALPVRWSRDPGRHRRLRSIRFGSFRTRPREEIRIHPRLARPWVARAFLEHVVHHEYCHWRQHCEPVRGERHHSARFKRWERGFPGFDRVVVWQRAHLDALLAPEDEAACPVAWSPAGGSS